MSGPPEITVTGKNNSAIADGTTTVALFNGTEFGTIDVGLSATSTFTITNVGTDPLTLSGNPVVSISGPAAADFSIVSQPAGPLSGGASVSFQVRFSPTGSGTRSATITIANNDSDENPYNFAVEGVGRPTVTLAVSPATTAEGGAPLVYTFSRTGTGDALEVAFKMEGTAFFGSDYSISGQATNGFTTGTIVIPSGASSVNLTVTPLADNSTEDDETVIISLQSRNNYVNGNPVSATATITNAVPPAVAVSVAVAPAGIAENAATPLVYTFTRTGATANSVTISFSLGGTATFTTDYTVSGAPAVNAGGGAVTIPAGAASAVLTVTPVNDSAVEADETVIVTVTSGAGYSVSAPASATGTISESTTANRAPTLTSVTVLSGAQHNKPFTISYALLAEAANEADADNDPISFRIEQVIDGTLTKGGQAVVPGTTTLSAGESLVYTPATRGSSVAAFSIVASDGKATSSPAVTVTVEVRPTLTSPNLRGRPGSFFLFSGVNFTPNTPVIFTVNGRPVLRLRSDAEGSFVALLFFHRGTPAGIYNLSAIERADTGLAQTAIADATVTIAADAELLPRPATLPAGTSEITALPTVYLPVVQR